MGLTTALQLLEQRGDITIDLYTDREVSATTSYGSGGAHWGPGCSLLAALRVQVLRGAAPRLPPPQPRL